MLTNEDIREALRTVVDPELGMNIVDLGLVCDIVLDGRQLLITMTMTSPACPLGDFIKAQVLEALEPWAGEFDKMEVDVVSDPEWTPERMSEAARRQLGGGWK
jgi:metal-sulfur cluster biosynthetic enzyme